VSGTFSVLLTLDTCSYVIFLYVYFIVDYSNPGPLKLPELLDWDDLDLPNLDDLDLPDLDDLDLHDP